MDAAIVVGQLDPYRPPEQGPMANPYGPLPGCLDHTTAYDDAYVERQVSLDGGDDVNHGDDPHDIP